jgi:YegS/Rv2252/BmrU family lipid kinase
LRDQLASALAPGTSSIVLVSEQPIPAATESYLEQRGADLMTAPLSLAEIEQLEDQVDEANAALVRYLRETSAGKTGVPYQRIHIIVNPAAGKDEPILNTLNDVFGPYGIDWDVSITHKYGDATDFARRAAEAGVDLVAGYGGDGTQHEIANGILGKDVVMGVLPGGTGNGFANEIGIPQKLRPAVELLCTSRNTRDLDVVKLGDSYFIQRLYVGIEPEQQTSREDKNKYGTLAYAISTFRLARTTVDVPFQITIDDQVIEMPAAKVYVVNAAQSGTGISVTGSMSQSDDGLVDVFALSVKNLRTIEAAADRMLNLQRESAGEFFWQGKTVSIDTDPDQPVWTDGEYTGRTPISMEVVPGALRVVVP